MVDEAAADVVEHITRRASGSPCTAWVVAAGPERCSASRSCASATSPTPSSTICTVWQSVAGGGAGRSPRGKPTPCAARCSGHEHQVDRGHPGRGTDGRPRRRTRTPNRRRRGCSSRRPLGSARRRSAGVPPASAFSARGNAGGCHGTARRRRTRHRRTRPSSSRIRRAAAVIDMTAAASGSPPVEPWKVAFPNENTPPSAPTNQYPRPSLVIVRSRIGAFRRKAAGRSVVSPRRRT